MDLLRFFLRNFEELVAGVFMVLMSLATFLNVVARYLFSNPIPWAEEFSRYAFIWLVFMGAVVATKRKKHIIIEALLVFLPRRIRSFFLVLADIATLALMAVMVHYGWVLTLSANQPTSTLKVPQYVVYVVVPIAGLLIILYSLGDLRQNLRGAFSGVDDL